MILLVTWAGYPGVVCVTPMAWLLALRAGNICVARSKKTAFGWRWMEATVAGASFGLLQGLLFRVIVPLLGPIQADEQTSATVIAFLMLGMGVFAGAVLSFFTIYLNERRRLSA